MAASETQAVQNELEKVVNSPLFLYFPHLFQDQGLIPNVKAAWQEKAKTKLLEDVDNNRKQALEGKSLTETQAQQVRQMSDKYITEEVIDGSDDLSMLVERFELFQFVMKSIRLYRSDESKAKSMDPRVIFDEFYHNNFSEAIKDRYFKKINPMYRVAADMDEMYKSLEQEARILNSGIAPAIQQRLQESARQRAQKWKSFMRDTESDNHKYLYFDFSNDYKWIFGYLFDSHLYPDFLYPFADPFESDHTVTSQYSLSLSYFTSGMMLEGFEELLGTAIPNEYYYLSNRDSILFFAPEAWRKVITKRADWLQFGADSVSEKDFDNYWSLEGLVEDWYPEFLTRATQRSIDNNENLLTVLKELKIRLPTIADKPVVDRLIKRAIIKPGTKLRELSYLNLNKKPLTLLTQGIDQLSTISTPDQLRSEVSKYTDREDAEAYTCGTVLGLLDEANPAKCAELLLPAIALYAEKVYGNSEPEAVLGVMKDLEPLLGLVFNKIRTEVQPKLRRQFFRQVRDIVFTEAKHHD